jgi:hypothetical protein
MHAYTENNNEIADVDVCLSFVVLLVALSETKKNLFLMKICFDVTDGVNFTYVDSISAELVYVEM